ncbi:hypothetical protein Tco_0257085, partial [Tanacetum coccineum]
MYNNITSSIPLEATETPYIHSLYLISKVQRYTFANSDKSKKFSNLTLLIKIKVSTFGGDYLRGKSTWKLEKIKVLTDEEEYVFCELITSVPVVATSKVKTSESKPKSVSEPLNEDWISNSEDENETQVKSKQRKPSFAKVEFVKSNEHVKIPRESVEK